MECVEIKNYPNYIIYIDGRVYSKKTKRFLTQCLNRGGYYIVNLCKKGFRPKSHRVHRLVAEHFLPQIEGLKDVNHKDGVKTNNHINNLEWSNKSLNGLHAHRLGLNHGPSMKGEEHPGKKLSEEDVIKIRELHGLKTNKELAKQYNITTTQIWRIVTRKCWNHI